MVLTLLPAAKCLQCQNWNHYKGRGCAHLWLKREKWPSQYLQSKKWNPYKGRGAASMSVCVKKDKKSLASFGQGFSAVSQDSNCICTAPCAYFRPPSTTSPSLLSQSPSFSIIVVLLKCLNFKLIVYCQCVHSENNSDCLVLALKSFLVGYISSY